MPAGGACGIVLLLYVARVCFLLWCVKLSLSSCTASDLLLLKLLLFLRCDVPVFSTLAVRHSFPGTKQTVRNNDRGVLIKYSLSVKWGLTVL